MIKVEIIAQHATPLCFLPSGKLIYYKLGKIYIINKSFVERKINIIHSKKERWLGKSRYLYRLLRLGIRAAIAISEEVILISIGNYIHELNLENEILSRGYYCGDGIRPLTFTILEGVSSFSPGVYFGGYLGNGLKNPVGIYHRIDKDKWEEVFTFSEGEINHIHNIIEDRQRDCVWILTGDFGKASAIWKAENNFSIVKRFVSDNQIYRSCVAFALEEGLLYATDTPFTDNFICLLNFETKEVKKLCPIEGSSIYGCQWKKNYVFSTTIEGDGRDTSKWEFFFSRKNGSGIKDHKIHLYIGNLKNGFNDIYQQNKDWMPYCTFQFGAFKFPYGYNVGPCLYFQPIASKKYDLDLLKLEFPN